jgi:membrane-bound serine protease (ClpP class)
MLQFLHLVLASPTLAFVLLIIGVLGIYREFLNPGRVIPGVVGLALTVIAAYCLWQNGPTAIGLVLIGAAVLLFVAECLWDFYFLPGILATLLLMDGFRRLIPAPKGISLAFAVVGSCVLGGVTILLAYAARRARQNKWSDIPPVP